MNSPWNPHTLPPQTDHPLPLQGDKRPLDVLFDRLMEGLLELQSTADQLQKRLEPASQGTPVQSQHGNMIKEESPCQLGEKLCDADRRVQAVIGQLRHMTDRLAF
jgi:hypothetical protein